MTDYTFDRPYRWLEWARETFGDIAIDPAERAMRAIEEAIEVAQSAGLSRERLCTITDRVYARPAGSIEREIGQSLATLELLAHVLGVDASAEADAELARVKSISKEEWRRRHAAKVDAGFALSKVGEIRP